MGNTAKIKAEYAREYECEARARGCRVEDLSGRTRKRIRELARSASITTPETAETRNE